MNRAWWGYRLWQLTCLPEVAAFHLGRLRPTQERLLSTYLSRQSRTLFGRRHGLSGTQSYSEFCERVPVSTYEELLPYLQAPEGLSTDPVKIWEPTGGSSGGSKWIPWNGTLQTEFQRAVAVWIWHLLSQHPEVSRGRGYWQLTPKAELNAPSWVAQQRHGFERDSEYLGRLGRWLERSVLLIPPSGPHLWEQTIELLLSSPDLRLISCWSPSFLLVLKEKMAARVGRWAPSEWWPDLQLLSFWTQGPSAAYEPVVRELFPEVGIQPKGLLSTEAVVTIPVGNHYPLAYRSHFFEFESGSGILPAWKLETGQEVSVIVTTGSGLTRYRTGDRVRVTGFRKDLPCLEFLGRDGVSDHRGEKLTIPFLESLLEGLGGFVMLAFEENGYVLFTDDSQPVQQRHEQIVLLEQRLLENFSYADCRQLHQLQPLRGFLVTGDALAQYGRALKQMHGVEPATVKAQRFHPFQGWSREFDGRFLLPD